MDGGEAFPERGVSGADRALTVLSGGVVLDVSREVLLPFFLGWHQPFAVAPPAFLYCHFLLPLVHKPSSNILTSYLTALAGRQGEGGCNALFACRSPFQFCAVSAVSKGFLPVPWGAVTIHYLSPPHPLSG